MYRYRILRVFTQTKSRLCSRSKTEFETSTVHLIVPKLNASSVHTFNAWEESDPAHTTRRNFPANTYRFNDGLWFYRALSSYDDCPNTTTSVQLMFLRRKVRNKPMFTFRLDSKIPLKEPDLNNKRNVYDSGDVVNNLEPVDFSKPMPGFENSEELKTASDDVKRLFSFAMAPRKVIVEHQMSETLAKIRRHSVDDSSPEVYVATLTVKIRSLQEVYRENSRNVAWKQMIMSMTDKRNKQLRIMRMQDMRRFNWLVQALGITYRPSVLGAKLQKPVRTTELTRMTEEYCEKLKNDRLDAYHKKLKEQQSEFLQEKAKTLKWIEEQEQKFGLRSDK